VIRLNLPVLIFLLLLSLVLPVRTYIEIKGRAQHLEQLRSEIVTLRDKYADLEEEFAYRQSPLYIEKEAREQLNYAKEGEIIVILPDLEEAEGKEKDSGAVASSNNPYPQGRAVPFWQANAKSWRRLFFSN